MAVNPVQFLVASNASILDGTKTITISGGVNASRVFSGTAVFLGGADNPAEAVSGTAPDGSGISTITLRNNWTQGDVSNQSLVAFNTNEGLAEAISNVREIVSNASALEDLATEGLVKRIDDNNYEVVSITSLGESLVGANDSGTARSVLALGSAATKNVGTSGGNVMEVGAFGIGATSTPAFLPTSDIDDATSPAGLYRIDDNVTGGRPTGASLGTLADLGTLSVTRYNSTECSQFFTSILGATYTRFHRNTEGWTDWLENYHSGNSVNPLDYGIGNATTTNETDLNTGIYVESGITIISEVVSDMVNAPTDPTTTSRYIVTFDGTTGNGVQRITNRVSGRTWQRSFATGGTIGDWVELYHSGNLVNPLDYGLGLSDTSNAPAVGDLNTAPSGLLRTNNSGTLNTPDGSGFWTILSQNYSGETGTQLAMFIGGKQIWYRGNPNSAWSDWVELYHSGNTNFNEFGGGTVLGIGYASSTSSIVLALPVTGGKEVKPSSISVVGGWTLRNIKTGATEYTGQTPTLGTSSSSYKCAYIVFSGLTVNQGDTYLVIGDNSSTRFTVNF